MGGAVILKVLLAGMPDEGPGTPDPAEWAGLGWAGLGWAGMRFEIGMHLKELSGAWGYWTPCLMRAGVAEAPMTQVGGGWGMDCCLLRSGVRLEGCLIGVG